MCETWEEIKLEGKEEGLKEGLKEARLASLKSLLKNTDMTLEEAMNVLEFSEEERQVYKEEVM